MRYDNFIQSANPISSVGTSLFRNLATAMVLVGRRHMASNWLAGATLLSICGFYHAASANPVVEIIDAASWDLPIGETANIFLQRGWYQSSGTNYNANGTTITGPSTTEYVGLPSFAHFFFYDALPK